MSDYFRNDEYWKEHINKKLEEDVWIEDYKNYMNLSGKCLDLGCGIGQYSKKLMEYGMDVISTDISEIALNEVKKFNPNIKKVDMSENLPFNNFEFDTVFASLSIHYFDDTTTKKLMKEINRVLKVGGIFIGSVNGTEGINAIKDTAIELEPHYYSNKGKNIRLFDGEDLRKYLNIFKIEKIDKKEIIRFEHKKNYYIFIAKKEK